MLFFRWRRRSARATLVDPGAQVLTAEMSQQARTTRRYLEESDYLLPKDKEEEYRLNFQHYALYQAIGSHYVAPIVEHVRLMLDIGAGTGIWPMEMAALFPQAQVIGIDIDPALFKPDLPENCYLRTGNVLSGLPFPDALFGYTHQRLLTAAITAENWPRVVRELIRVTRPGGWVECVEIDHQMQNAGPAGQQLQELMASVGKSLGFDGEVIRHLGDLLKQEGLQSVEVQPIVIPVGEWGGRAGSMMKRDFLSVIDTLKPLYCQRGALSPASFDQLVQVMAGEWETYQARCTFFVAYGKRVRA
ncbi:MAG TPA: methyltransferase domain-containing protein [Ktedonobacteraceae bacterium]|nr:methyltransferase domain-containing protein [Ktedonobacteraceae bacterium]